MKTIMDQLMKEEEAVLDCWVVFVLHILTFVTCTQFANTCRAETMWSWNLWPLHTRAKDCDHVIVRALDSHLKAILAIQLTWCAM